MPDSRWAASARLALAILLPAVPACRDAAEPATVPGTAELAAYLAGGEQSFVLTPMGSIAGEPITVLDHCGSDWHHVRLVWDTITLRADSSVRRAITTRAIVNDTGITDSHTSTVGRWSVFVSPPPRTRFFSDGPSIRTVTQIERSPYTQTIEALYRLRLPDTLETLMTLDPSGCPAGSAPKPDSVVLYVRR